MRFVLKVALHYRTCPVPIPDLVNEGVLGLARAIESYERTGIKFISYAVWSIRSYMVRAIEDKGAVIRLPANEHARLRKLKRQRKAGDGGEKPGKLEKPARPASRRGGFGAQARGGGGKGVGRSRAHGRRDPVGQASRGEWSGDWSIAFPSRRAS